MRLAAKQHEAICIEAVTGYHVSRTRGRCPYIVDRERASLSNFKHIGPNNLDHPIAEKWIQPLRGELLPPGHEEARYPCENVSFSIEGELGDSWLTHHRKKEVQACPWAVSGD